MTPTPAGSAPARPGPRLGPVRISPLLILVAVLFVASPAVMLWAVARVKDEAQVTLLQAGAIGLALAFGLVTLACLRGMWRAAAVARSGRALGLALVAGVASLGAIGSITVVILLTLLWGT